MPWPTSQATLSLDKYNSFVYTTINNQSFFLKKKKWLTDTNCQKHTPNCNNILISSFVEINFEINISDKKSRHFDLPEVIFKCIKVL